MEGQNANSTISKINIIYTKFSNCNAIKLEVTKRKTNTVYFHLYVKSKKQNKQTNTQNRKE